MHKQRDISTFGAGRGSDIILGEPVDQEDEANGIFRVTLELNEV